MPANEAERLAALHRYQILDTPPEAAFDRITALAARLFNVPIALVSLVDESRAWFKSSFGFDASEVPRDDTICSIALLYDDVFVVPDTRLDERLICNPLVQQEPGLRFYAGAPLLTSSGFNLGTLCLLDMQPRDPFTPEQKRLLADLAAIVVDELELRLSVYQIAQQEAALRDHASRLEMVQQATQSGSWDWDFVANIAYVSPQYSIIFGLAPETSSSSYEQWLGQVHPDDRDRVLEHVSQVIRQGQGYSIQYRILHPEGIRWVDSCGQVYYNAAGQPIRMVGNVQDITERKQDESEREQTLIKERKYACQLQGLTSAAVAINSALSVEEVLRVITDQAATTIGAHQSVTSLTIDQNWAQAINAVHLSDKYARWRDYAELPDGSGIYACVCHLNRPMRMTQAELEAHPRWKGFGGAADRHPPMRGWLAAPLVGRDGHNIGLIQLSDKYEGEFTEADESILVQLAQMASIAVENVRLYEAEQQARSAAEAAREAAQTANRVKDEFLAVLSHELRSPLNPILGWTQLLRSCPFEPEARDRALEVIERNARLQTQLIEDLLDVSRILRGKLLLTTQPVNLATVVESALETVRLSADAKGIVLQKDLPETSIYVSGDSSRLQQIVWNLLSNAVKFTPTDGHITITIQQQNGEVLIQVEDTGKGISAEFLPYVFDYFRQEDSTTTRKFGGLGLGLAIVRHLTELHGGSVEVKSPGEGLGNTFTVRLPVLKQDSPVAQPAPKTDAPEWLPLADRQILVVDDEADMRDLLAAILTQYGAKGLAEK